MPKITLPSAAGVVRFYENVKPLLKEKYGLTVTATISDFTIDDDATGKRIASGDTIQWLNGFVNGLDACLAREKK